jgi:hypothetical protein
MAEISKLGSKYLNHVHKLSKQDYKIFIYSWGSKNILGMDWFT